MLDQRGEGATGYVDGYILPVAHGNKDAYSALAQTASTVFLDHGAVRVVECWGDDVPDGKVTDYRRAAHAVDGENVVFSWVEWPSKDARTAGWEKAMADERLHPNEREMPFDGKRMIYGGFAPVFDA
ncbi:MAG: DUF1428 domain-containing protein [Sphingopyxis sp.]|nr:DUF1428 domain-containing protein [Sphingopyxis sp.]MDZ3830574.1 DUF1428 domain-containing protein [Sphingopyxis sp.]